MLHEHHLTDGELLLFIDREWPSRRLASAAAHLAQCAACRHRQVQLDGAARDFTASYQQTQDPAGRSGHARHVLRSRLHELAGRPAGWPLSRLMAMAAVAAAAVLVVRITIPSSPAESPRATASVDGGALPVASLTPGATWNVSLGELCAPGAREQRPIPGAVRAKVVRDYGMLDVPSDKYELDYLITPELGGAPDARNLWPQRYTAGVWNARVKDDLEQLLPRLVCNRQLDLQAAQRDIAVDWIAAYKKYFNTGAPVQRVARDEGDDSTYPVWRSAGAPALELISFSARR